MLLFASLGMVVYFADHLIHSIQIDAINRRIEKNTRRAIGNLHTRTHRGIGPSGPRLGGAVDRAQVGIPADRAP